MPLWLILGGQADKSERGGGRGQACWADKPIRAGRRIGADGVVEGRTGWMEWWTGAQVEGGGQVERHVS